VGDALIDSKNNVTLTLGLVNLRLGWAVTKINAIYFLSNHLLVWTLS